MTIQRKAYDIAGAIRYKGPENVAEVVNFLYEHGATCVEHRKEDIDFTEYFDPEALSYEEGGPTWTVVSPGEWVVADDRATEHQRQMLVLDDEWFNRLYEEK